MTTVGVVSDTHLPRFGRELPRALVEGLRAARVSRILHCGDFTEPLAVELLEAIAPLDAVAGNNDGEALWNRFGRKKIVEIDGVAIGLVHGDGTRSAAVQALGSFSGERVDAICFGHSHAPLIERHEGILLLNPGSPTERRRSPRFSYAVLRISGGTAQAELCYFDDRRA
ncbi:MAG: metallophosphoesterase family protein [Candidatus Velthaea sp.]